MTRFVFSAEKCTACGACAVACMDENDIDVENGQHPYRVVYRRERAGRSEYISAACRHCAAAPCVSACAAGCMRKDEATGLTLCDIRSCVGCGACAEACPFGAVHLWRGAADKCRGCPERLAAGLPPACVRACPTGALRCVHA